MPQEPRLTDHLYIKIDGQDLPADAMDDLIEVSVETSLRLPDMFMIHLHDVDLRWVDEGPFVLGKEVEIAALPEEGGESKVLIKGEITSLEPDFAEGALATLRLRGYDRSHRLHRGTHAQAFVQMTDSDIAERIAQDAGLRAEVDPTNEVYDHVMQDNQTHLEFLASRAQRIGYEVYVEDRTLHFRSPSSDGGELEVEWGRQLRSFQPRQTLAEQVDEVIVQGWDPKTRDVVSGQATRGEAEPELGEGENGGQVASQAFDSARRMIVDRIVHSQAEADALAQAILDDISGAYVEAEGLCYAQPELRAGKMLRVTGLGHRFSGTYLVTAATHIYRAGTHFQTYFSILGRRPDGLYSQLSRIPSHDNGRSGPVIGIVTNNNDPEDRGRLKVKFPWLSEDVESDWARLVAVGAGNERGLFCLPEVNDEVLVVFEHGDIGRPYVLGGLWNGEDAPPVPTDQALESGRVHRRMFKTRSGHVLTFVDDSDAGVTLETAGGHRLAFLDEGKVVQLETSGGHKIVLDDSSSKLSVESTRDLSVKSAANLTLEAGAKLELKGATFTLSADGSGEVKSSGTLKVQGSLVQIN